MVAENEMYSGDDVSQCDTWYSAASILSNITTQKPIDATKCDASWHDVSVQTPEHRDSSKNKINY